MNWNQWTDEQWLANPAMPATFLGTSEDWQGRVDFMQRKLRGRTRPRLAEARSTRWTPIAGAKPFMLRPQTGLRFPMKVDDGDIRAERERVERERQRIDATLAVRKYRRKREKAEADVRLAEESEQRAVRARAGYNARAVPAEPTLRASSVVKVGTEPAIYGPGSDFSYFRDMWSLRASFAGIVPSASMRYGDHPDDARARLLRHQKQMQCLARNGTDEERALIRDYFIEKNRRWHQTVSDRGHEDWRNFVFAEVRDDSTASGSLGTFTPPVYLLQQWILWRTAASPVASQGAQRQLPATGMSIDVPELTSKVSIEEQATQNTTVAASTPTVGFVAMPVLTLAGQVTFSQQLMDRSGVSIDQVLAEQGARQAGTVLDTKAIAGILAALPTANKISNTATSPSIAALWADIAKASMLTRTTEGTRLPLDAVMIPPANLAWFQGRVDTEGRPIWSPSAAGVVARSVSAGPTEGYSGYDVQGARVFTDANLPVTPDAKLLAGNFGRGLLVYTGAPIIDVYPETKADTLSVVINMRQYAAFAVVYPSAFVSITSTTGAYPKTPTFTGS